MPMDFSDPNFLVQRATRVWGWRFPTKGESQKKYRAAFADYVALSDKEEAAAIRKAAVFTKFDAAANKTPAAKRKAKKAKGAKTRRARAC